MRITWVTRSFLDYRIPVYAELHKLCGHELTLIYFRDVVPERVHHKLVSVLHERAIGLSGELRLSGAKSSPLSTLGRKGVRIPYQPGLIRQIRASKPEVMVSDGFFQWSYATLALRAFGRIPHVMCYEPTAHTERNAQWYRTTYRRFVSRWIDSFCCNGVLCRDYTKSLGILDSQITMGNMAADSDGLTHAVEHLTTSQVDDCKTKYACSGGVFLYVGRLVELKGIMQLLHAWLQAGIPATLLLVGDGPEREHLQEFCHVNSLTSVRFVGALDYEQLPVFYKSADVFIMPTLQDNWSLVVPEAMACGLPIACSIYNGCHPELVTSANGWTFDPLDVNGTTAVLQEIVAKREALAAMGEASRRIVADYTPRHAAEAIFNACCQAREKHR